MKLTVLFGAGASFGCGYNEIESTPPLGNALFQKLVGHCPQSWGNCIPLDLIPTFNMDFELGMLRLWSRSNVNMSPLLVDMAVYFTYFEPPPTNNQYERLINALESKRLMHSTGFVSLNYECVFELTAHNMGIQDVFSSNTNKRSNGISLWKPHGSCNFISEARVINIAIWLTGKDQRYYDGPMQVLPPKEVRKRYAGPEILAIPPAISLYTAGKATLTAEGYIFEIRKAMEDWITDSDIVVCIGVRPNLADKHIWDPIILSNAAIWFIGGEGESLDALRAKVGDNKLKYIGKEFKKCLGVLIDDLRSLSIN